MGTLLLVEDDRSIMRSLTEFLTAEGFSVKAAAGQARAEEVLSFGGVDLCLVDLTLADGSGYGVCAAAKKRDLPVIFLTASGDESSVVRGLDMGADDYVAKPFRPRELVSRIKSVLRRTGHGQRVVQIGGLTVDTDRAAVTKNGTEINLSALEYRLLTFFLNNRGRVLTRDRLLEEIWDAGGDFVNDNTLTVYVKRLREKIEDDPQAPALIQTVRGIGYRIN